MREFVGLERKSEHLMNHNETTLMREVNFGLCRVVDTEKGLREACDLAMIIEQVSRRASEQVTE